MRTFLILALTFILISLLSGCSKQDVPDDMPDVLRIGILPDESKEILVKRYTPLFLYLSQQLDITYQLKISEDYKDLLKQFESDAVDLAYFGGYTFVQAQHSSNAVPLVMRDIDERFTSYFISNVDIPLKRISEFKGKSFAFGSKLSTSGHLMPRFFMMNQKIEPEVFFSKIKYSGAHDKTAHWVSDGHVDIGVANSKVIDKMILDGRLNQNKIHILWETPPYPDYVWAIQSRFSKNTQTKIRNVFLSLSPAIKEHAIILSGVDAGGFVPASHEDFSKINEVANQFGILEGMSEQ